MDFRRIISDLRAERDRIDQAISAIESLGSTNDVASHGRIATPHAGPRQFGRRRMSPAARKRISEMMKKRWAERKSKSTAARHMSPAARRRISEMMKKRWAERKRSA